MAGEVNFTPDGRKQRKQSRSEWEIVGGLKDGEKYEERPMKFDGFLHKKRNPPLKGWHRVSLSTVFRELCSSKLRCTVMGNKCL